MAPVIDAAMRPTARPLPFVGRDRELAEILATARDASPDGRLILIEGEAGIGKTRLAEVATDSIRDRGGLVLASRAYPGEDAIAFGPIADLLRVGLATPNGVAGLTALDPVALGEVGRLVDLPTSLRATARPVTMTGDYAQVRLLDAIADALTALVLGPVPGVVWIDDLHHADASTRLVVTYLSRRLRARPIALLLAWRREDLTSDGLITADELSRVPGALALTPERLDRAAVAELVRATGALDRRRPARRRLHRLRGGRLGRLAPPCRRDACQRGDVQRGVARRA